MPPLVRDPETEISPSWADLEVFFGPDLSQFGQISRVLARSPGFGPDLKGLATKFLDEFSNTEFLIVFIFCYFFNEFSVDIHIIKLQQSMRNLLNLTYFLDLSVPNGIIKINEF